MKKKSNRTVEAENLCWNSGKNDQGLPGPVSKKSKIDNRQSSIKLAHGIPKPSNSLQEYSVDEMATAELDADAVATLHARLRERKPEILAALSADPGLSESLRRLEAQNISIAVLDDGTMCVIQSEPDRAAAIRDGFTVYSPRDAYFHLDVRLLFNGLSWDSPAPAPTASLNPSPRFSPHAIFSFPFSPGR